MYEVGDSPVGLSSYPVWPDATSRETVLKLSQLLGGAGKHTSEQDFKEGGLGNIPSGEGAPLWQEKTCISVKAGLVPLASPTSGMGVGRD